MERKWNPDVDYLSIVDTHYTGVVGNLFCLAVRQGADNVKAILESVERECYRVLGSRYSDHIRMRNYEAVLDSLVSEKASAFAEHILWRENLPEDIARKLKQESRADGLEKAMDIQLPSEKQLNYLKSLGCQIVPKTKLEASKLINQFITK